MAGGPKGNFGASGSFLGILIFSRQNDTMPSTSFSIGRWIHRIWLLSYFRRYASLLFGALVVLLLAFGLLGQIFVFWGGGGVVLEELFFYEGLALGGIAVCVLFLAFPGRKDRFTREIDRRAWLNGQLATWNDLDPKQQSLSIHPLFVSKLARTVQNLKIQALFPARPLLPRLFGLMLGILLHAFLFLQSEEGFPGLKFLQRRGEEPGTLLLAGEGGAKKVGSSKDSSEDSSSLPSEEKTGPEDPGSDAPEENQQPIEREAKYVPPLKRPGPTTLKEVYVFDLPLSSSSSRSQTDPSQSFAENYAELRKIAEQAVDRGILEEEEKKFVSSYFERIRPQ